MAKKRRERDRPKASHNALYNPNKRVRLCYASDEEAGSGLPEEAINTRHANTAGATTPAEEHFEESESESSCHSSTHRELFEEAWEEDDLDEVENKGRTANSKSLWTRGVRRNDTTGQWAAIGSLSYQWDDQGEEEEDYDSEEEEAMSYLRAVRSERQGMPMVFKAPNTYSHEEIYETGDGDTRGYYEDGAYVARASLGPHLPAMEKLEVEPQEAFAKSLKERFFQQRHQMHLSPDPNTLVALDDTHPISFPERSNNAHAEWHRLIRTRVPKSAQLKAMPQQDVLRLVELIHKHHLVRETDIPSNVSTWIWSLLARLGDVGAMDNDQVWQIRELGRKAVLVQLSFNDSAAAEQLEGVATQETTEERISSSYNSGPLEEPSNAPDTLEESDPSTVDDSASQAMKSDEITNIRLNTLATLDMIIILVGEVFGQRDLLDFRETWNEQKESLHEE